MSPSIKSKPYLPSTVCCRAELALWWLWPALHSPCSPASCGHLLSGQGSREIEGSLFTGQAQIRFLTAPPERLCQGKLALQNCSLTGKCVSLFISHSHWKKGGVGGSGWSWCHSFHPTSQRHHISWWLPGTSCVSLQSTKQNWPRAWSFSSFSQHSALPYHLFLTFFLPEGFASSLRKGTSKPRSVGKFS